MLNTTHNLLVHKIVSLLRRNSPLVVSVLATLALMVPLLMPIKVNAANVTMSLVSSAATVQQSGTFTVDVRLSTGSATILDAVARVNFNPTQLSLQSQSYAPSSSWGGIEGPDAAGGTGYYEFHVMKQGPPYSGGSLGLVQLTFQALGSSGTTPITITNASVGSADADAPATNFVHNVSVQGINIALAPTPAANEPVSPGTIVPQVDPNAPARFGEPTNPEVNQAVPITEEAEITALNEDNEQAAKELDAEIAANLATISSSDDGLSTDKNNSQSRWITVAAITTIAAIVGFIVYSVIQRRNGGGGLSGGSSSDSSGLEPPQTTTEDKSKDLSDIH